uniref:Putative secreted peptide n=1 Tax=Anopheles braziliensis TaxID=58242 RepID=A0A2M3ZNY8_9DIPT
MFLWFVLLYSSLKVLSSIFVAGSGDETARRFSEDDLDIDCVRNEKTKRQVKDGNGDGNETKLTFRVIIGGQLSFFQKCYLASYHTTACPSCPG